jgi:hypothetical protein
VEQRASTAAPERLFGEHGHPAGRKREPLLVLRCTLVCWSRVTSGSVEGASSCATTPLDFDTNPREFHETTRGGWVAPPRQARG